ncbi:MAG TPA: LytTR family DNA-binding domain-containing protein [Steroidobacteraceae bacterium]|nr:LytTR family DNA-binding domain-containing protein [Steroidobacteraceae bacterium]
MRVLRVVIVDDEPPARDKLRRWLSEQPDLEVVAEVGDGVSAVQCIGVLLPDVVFLDIQMPAMNGLEVAAQLQSTAAPLLVFVTAFGDHALRAFDLNAIDYLLKPYDKERLLRTLQRVRERAPNKALHSNAIRIARQASGGANRLLVPDGDKLSLIERDSIRWMQADDNYVHVHCSTAQYVLRRTLQDLLAQIGESQFVRIHKSTAVNVAEIQALHPLFKGDYEVHLRDGTTLRLSRRYKDDVFARLGR